MLLFYGKSRQSKFAFGHPLFFLRLASASSSGAFLCARERDVWVRCRFSVVRPTHICRIFKKKTKTKKDDGTTQLNHFSLEIILVIGKMSIVAAQRKTGTFCTVYCAFCLIQICKGELLTSSWGTKASYSETSGDFFFLRFFFFNPTDRSIRKRIRL